MADQSSLGHLSHQIPKLDKSRLTASKSCKRICKLRLAFFLSQLGVDVAFCWYFAKPGKMYERRLGCQGSEDGISMYGDGWSTINSWESDWWFFGTGTCCECRVAKA